MRNQASFRPKTILLEKGQNSQPRLSWYAVARQIPDLLTLLRLALAVILFGSAVVDGAAQPGRDIWLLVIGWATDMADGRISRAVKKKRRFSGLRLVWPAAVASRYEAIRAIYAPRRAENTSWLGRHDVYVDMFVSVAVLGYLMITGLVPVWGGIVYLLVWGVLFLRWGVPEVFAQIFQNPIYAAFVALTVRDAPEVLPWLLAWAGVALLFFWRRMAQLLKNLVRTVRG